MALFAIIGRAKGLGCYQARARGEAHDHEVVITVIGALIRHDAFHHRWSPHLGESRILIISIDDFSQKLLSADLCERETARAHIKAAESAMLTYGIPLR